MNNSGKTLTIFLFVIAILLVSLTAIAVFFFLKEVELRKSAEYNLEQLRVIEEKIQIELKEAKKQLYLKEEKTKELEERIEELMQDVELEQDLKEEIKKENRALQEALDKELQEKQAFKDKTGADLAQAEQTIGQLQDKIAALEQAQKNAVPAPTVATPQPAQTTPSPEGGEPTVSLEPIVINPNAEDTGRVINVDQETQFIIASLGQSDGVDVGTVLSIYRADKYIGDVKVTRVLPEMSAADFIPPLTGQKVQKDDLVIIKK